MISLYIDIQSDCMKSRPDADCSAEYKKSTAGYSQWKEFSDQLTPVNIAVVELAPPVVIGILWLFVWGSVAVVRWVLHGFGVQFKKKPEEVEPSEPKSVMERVSAIGRWLIAPRNILSLSIGIVALAVSYYFVISLPVSNHERLQFEKDKVEAAKVEREKKEEADKQAIEDRKMSFLSCEAEADTTYWNYVKLNGKEVAGKPGAYSAPTFIWTAAEKRKSDALAECHRQFDK